MERSDQERIAELRAACGCKEGMVALVLGLAAYGVALQYFVIGDTTLQRVLMGVAAGLGSALLGKVFGLTLAQLRLRHVLGASRRRAVDRSL